MESLAIRAPQERLACKETPVQSEPKVVRACQDLKVISVIWARMALLGSLVREVIQERGAQEVTKATLVDRVIQVSSGQKASQGKQESQA